MDLIAPLSNVRDRDRDAFTRVLVLELLFRRILRWELRGRFGKLWHTKLDRFAAEIEARRKRERLLGPIEPTSSDLAFLGLPEVVELVFADLWGDLFKAVFDGNRQYQHVPLRDVVIVRNKVAHFRPIRIADLEILKRSDDVITSIASYYGRRLAASTYLSGDPEKAGDYANDADVERLTRQLAERSLAGVWREFGALEGARAHGISPGMGLTDHHIYFEAYSTGSFRAKSLNDWAVQRQHELTFLTVARDASFVRAFLPTTLGEHEIVRAMRAFVNVARQSQRQNEAAPTAVDDEFDFGAIEWVVGEGVNSVFGFAF